ncbi:aminopeptidase P family protein [Acidianus brierleyi]|uniref:Aminopeptidase P family protein n=1 Tax=Acidianus brierleyi TaxID=41673 RepID=A0A2U9IFU7_9CREN|nr:aminopeptidase P family protein [Acidianus brierleyi]AWR94893.1 M24 family metallopeptidase [Acidianus brierleyi]
MRINKLSNIIEKGCGAIFGSSNIFYFTGYNGAGVLLYCDGVATLLAPLLEENRALETKGVDVKIYYPTKVSEDIQYTSIIDAIEKITSRNSIFADISSLDASTYLRLSSKFELKDISSQISALRSIKDLEELDIIKKSGEITSVAMRIAIDKATEQVNEKQLSGLIDYTMKTEGAEDYAFPSIVASGENSSEPHHIPTDRVIKEGDSVVIDIGAKYQGYCFDSTRTLLVKKFSNDLKKIYEIVLEAQLEAIDAVSDGIKASEIDRIARNVIEKNGFGKYFVHSTGHGVGIDVHESPYISFNSNDVLKKNMVITVEPGIYIKGKYGVRIEDTMIVTSGKPEVLETAYKLL